MYGVTRLNHYGKKVFDTKMSDAEEIKFFHENVCDVDEESKTA